MPASPNDREVPNPIEFELSLQERDIQQGLAALPRARIARILAWVGSACVLTLVAYRWQQDGDRTSLVLVVGIMVAYLLVSRDPTKRLARRIYRALPEARRTLVVKIDERGLDVRSGDQSVHVEWTEVIRVVVTRTTFLVFTSPTDAQILPKRALPADQAVALQNLIAARVVPRAFPIWSRELRNRIFLWLLLLVLLGFVLRGFGAS